MVLFFSPVKIKGFNQGERGFNKVFPNDYVSVWSRFLGLSKIRTLLIHINDI